MAVSDSAEMDDYFVSILIQDFSSDGYFEAGELLLEDLTNEELEYLEYSGLCRENHFTIYPP